MPALPPVPQVVKIVLEGTDGYRNWANILHVRYTGSAPSASDLSTYAGGVQEGWATAMIPMCDTLTTLESVTVIDLTSATSASGISTGVDAGVRTGSPLPGSAAALVTYPMPIRYRGGHARTYLRAGVDTDLENAGQWTSEFVGDLNSAWASFLADVYPQTVTSTNFSQLVAVSYVSKEVNPTPPYRRTTPEVYVLGGGFAVQTELASQRRRIGRK